MANGDNGRAPVDGHEVAAAAMAMNVPYLKSYVRGFPFDRIDEDVDLFVLHNLFDRDPPLHALLEEIEEHVHRLIERAKPLPNVSTLVDVIGGRGAHFVEVDNEEDDHDNNIPLPESVPAAAFGVQLLEMVQKLAAFYKSMEGYMDDLLKQDAKSLANKLNVAIQKLLNAEIVPVVYILREEALDQERRLKSGERLRAD